MSSGSVYDYLHKQNGVFKLPTLLKVAIDVSKGMSYLHQNNIIHSWIWPSIWRTWCYLLEFVGKDDFIMGDPCGRDDTVHCWLFSYMSVHDDCKLKF